MPHQSQCSLKCLICWFTTFLLILCSFPYLLSLGALACCLRILLILHQSHAPSCLLPYQNKLYHMLGLPSSQWLAIYPHSPQQDPSSWYNKPSESGTQHGYSTSLFRYDLDLTKTTSLTLAHAPASIIHCQSISHLDGSPWTSVYFYGASL